MKEVVFDAELQLAAGAARAALRRALETLRERSQRGEVSLAAVTETGAGSELARIAVPIVLETDDLATGGTLSLKIIARSAQYAFPRFSGTLFLEPLGPARTRVRLQGLYEVPLGPLGAAANALGLDAIAQQSLRHFLDDLIAQAEWEVRKADEETYRELRRTP